MYGRVRGGVDPAFELVRAVFAANFERGEIGAACAVVIGGRTVVDLWGGTFERDTIVNAYSVGKPLVALSVLQLVASGEIDLDAPARRWWPELRANATVREVLCHRAGLPAIRRRLADVDLWSWETMTAAIAETEPWWVPGTKHVYHSNTYGFLVGELARRVTGQMPGTWVRTLGADLFWGLGADEQARCADIVWEGGLPPTDWAWMEGLAEEQRMIALGYVNPPGFSSLGVVNTPEWRAAQVPSVNLHASARGIAAVYAALLAGTLLDPALLADATTTQSEGWCPVLEREVSFGLGFQPTRPDRPFGPNPRAYGHFGTGGALGFADPDADLAFGYVMNAVKPRWQNDRNRALVDAVYACL
jgi:CubicO group peptidase (beta-lactamase class C family)